MSKSKISTLLHYVTTPLGSKRHGFMQFSTMLLLLLLMMMMIKMIVIMIIRRNNNVVTGIYVTFNYDIFAITFLSINSVHRGNSKEPASTQRHVKSVNHRHHPPRVRPL